MNLDISKDLLTVENQSSWHLCSARSSLGNCSIVAKYSESKSEFERLSDISDLLNETGDRVTDAVTVIQRAWRTYIDKEIFDYYRDLIRFYNRGDPALMLRCINPKEARLMDVASGTHIRFRLGGESFPPRVYYKIYTHKPVVDMCSNSPKDYTLCKMPSGKQLHNKFQPPKTDDRNGWYQRTENNGWRLVTDRIYSSVTSDPVMFKSACQKISFPCSKLQRQQDVNRRRKSRKITWMKKMYYNGMMQVKAADIGTINLVSDVTDGMISMIKDKGEDEIDDWEVDQLIEWTTGLNFDRYLESWQNLATSVSTNKTVNYQQQKSALDDRDDHSFKI